MPNIAHGNIEGYLPVRFDEKFDYDYPEGLDLRPGSKLHQSLVSKVLERANESYDVMSRRHYSWNEVDQIQTGFIDIDEEERKVKRKDRRRPVSIVFPYSYAVMEVMLSYLVAAFLQEPYFRYEGWGPEDTVGAILLENVVNLHTIKTKVGLSLHTMLRDCLNYGIGLGTPGWEVRRGKVIVKTEEKWYSSFANALVGGRKGKREEDAVLFEGNKLDNVDVYKWFPDPTVSIHKIQEGEYCGWLSESNYIKLRKEELNDPDIFNVQYLQQHRGKRSKFGEDKSDRDIKHGGAVKPPQTIFKVDRLFMFVDLVPREWELGSSTNPERWMFELCNDIIITQARPSGLAHGLFPVAACAPDFDGYSATPVARLETLYGTQEVIDFLLNSHIANVRKAINDMLVVDPWLVNIKDLEHPEPGKLVRMRRPAWGQGMADKAVNQLVVQDITRANIADAGFMSALMNRVSGADESMSGMLRTGGPERLTSKEFQGTRAGSISRYERLAKVIGMQAFQDIGEMFAYHTQQLMDQEMYVRAVGKWPEVIQKEYGIQADGRVPVTPYDLLVGFDVVVRDGSVPGGNWNDAWVQLFQIIASQPLLGQKFDIVRIFTHIARGLGAKNVDDFEIKTMPNEQVQQQVQAGQLQPVGAMG